MNLRLPQGQVNKQWEEKDGESSEVRQTWVWILALKLISKVTFGKLLSSKIPQSVNNLTQ